MSLEQRGIARLRAADSRRFNSVSQNPEFQRSLGLPDPNNTLRVLIPARLYELAADPGFPYLNDPLALKVATIESRKDWLNFFILETKPAPITNMNHLVPYISVLDMFREDYLLDSSTPRPPMPPTVDRLHAQYYSYIQTGIITPNDLITHNVNIIRLGEENEELNVKADELFVAGYEDRDELRGLGITLSFYEQLREFARRLGFRFITGENSNDNYTFFTDKLGRVLLEDLTPEGRALIDRNHPVYDSEFVTVDLLEPEDRRRYIKR